jgi:Flp pilus assembly protein TadG
MGFWSWLKEESPPRKRAPRHRIAGMVAYYWDGGAPREHPVRDISLTGAFVYATEQWYIGTILMMTLRQRTEENNAVVTESCISLPCKIVRQDPDGGVGVRFMLPGKEEGKALERFIKDSMGNPHPKPGARAAEGQALVEFALIVPFLFLLIFNVVNFGGFLYNWIGVSNAARVGAQSASMGSAYAGFPSIATLAGIQTLIQNETASLPGASTTNPAVIVCENRNGTAMQYPPPPAGVAPTACPAATAPPQDPETITGLTGASTFTTVTVDVTFTYTSFIPSFSFSALSVFVPPSPIHIRTVMRVLN